MSRRRRPPRVRTLPVATGGFAIALLVCLLTAAAHAESGLPGSEALIALAAVASALALALARAFAISIRARTGELGTLRSLGASRARLLGAILAEALALGAAASLLGAIGGSILARLLDASPAIAGAPRPIGAATLAAILAAGTLLPVAAAAPPAIRVLSLTPLQALGRG